MRALFWKGPSTWFGRGIRLKTGSAYTHCELLFSDGKRFAIEAHIPARYYDAWPQENLSGGRLWDPALWDCLEFDGGDEALVRGFCDGEVGAKYDWLGITLSQLLPWGRQSSTKWFCSELTVAALQIGSFAQVASIVPHYVAPHEVAVALERGGARLVLPAA